MVGIIVVFPNKDNAANIRNLLVRGGMEVTGVCTTGAQALNYADAADDGIVVCGYKMKDMMYTELREYLSERFEMLLIAKAKELLMARNHMSEAEAHKYLQKSSMDSGTSMTETAQMILRVMNRG